MSKTVFFLLVTCNLSPIPQMPPLPLGRELGHHAASFTLDVYGHVTEEMKQASAARMEQYMKNIVGG